MKKGTLLLGRWRWRTTEPVATGQTTRTIKTPEVPRGTLRIVNRAMVYNDDSNNSVLLVSIDQDGTLHEVYTVTLSSKATWYPIKLETYVFPGECLRYAFSSCTAGDELRVREVGGTYEWMEEPPPEGGIPVEVFPLTRLVEIG